MCISSALCVLAAGGACVCALAGSLRLVSELLLAGIWLPGVVVLGAVTVRSVGGCTGDRVVILAGPGVAALLLVDGAGCFRHRYGAGPRVRWPVSTQQRA